MGEIFERPTPPEALPWTGERLTSATSGQVEIEHLHRYFFARALCRGRDVLDIACGEGYGAAMLAQVATSVTGVDVSADSVAHARAAYAAANLTYLAGDARRIPCPDAAFDAVVSFETIEHFHEHDAFLSEIRRVLRPGGILIMSSPERDVYSPAGSRPNPYHAHELTQAEFAALLGRSFQHVALYGQRPLLGSALVPETPADAAHPFLTFERRDERRFEASIGLPRAIYLLAVASDGPVATAAGSLFIETSGIETIYADLVGSRTTIAGLQAQVAQAAEQAAQVAALQAEIAALQGHAADVAVQRGQDAVYVESLRAQAAQADEARAALQGGIAGLERQIEDAKAQRGALEAETAAKLAAQAQHLEHARAQLHDCEAEYGVLVAASAAQLKQRGERYARLEAGFRAELRRVTEQGQAADAAHKAELAGLQVHLDELPKLGALGLAQQHELGVLRSYVARLEHDLNAVLSSTSWHLTGPLRGFTQRHPGAIGFVRGFMRKHPGLGRTALGTLRAGWRTATLRNPIASRPAPPVPDFSAPAVQPLPARAKAEPALPLKLRRIVPAERGREPMLPQAGARRALCVGHVMPYPPRAGNEYRVHRLLSWLAESGWQILVVICPLPHEMPGPDQIASAAAIYPNFLVLERDGTLHYRLESGDAVLRHDPAVWQPKLNALLEREGDGHARILNLQRSFCPDVLVRLLLQLEAGFKPDLLLAEYIFMTRPFTLFDPDLRTAIDTIDVFSTKARKVEQFAVSDGLALSADEEAPLLRRADILIAIQPEEAGELTQLAPEARVVSVGVDFPVASGDAGGAPGRTILLVASGNPMNVKGLEDFLHFAWPTVRNYAPDAEFVIAGSAADQMGALPDGVRTVGRVDDLRPLYAEARLVINPAVAGTGLKIKTVEALCHLRPIVCWPAGAEGIPIEVRRFCHIATDWFSFARNVADLLRGPDGALAVQRGREEIARVFSPDFVYAPLRDALLDA